MDKNKKALLEGKIGVRDTILDETKMNAEDVPVPGMEDDKEEEKGQVKEVVKDAVFGEDIIIDKMELSKQLNLLQKYMNKKDMDSNELAVYDGLINLLAIIEEEESDSVKIKFVDIEEA